LYQFGYYTDFSGVYGAKPVRLKGVQYTPGEWPEFVLKMSAGWNNPFEERVLVPKGHEDEAFALVERFSESDGWKVKNL
jgi:hypothetical protein